jgi:parvulin-like peptidyl-prolyl isomerase
MRILPSKFFCRCIPQTFGGCVAAALFLACLSTTAFPRVIDGIAIIVDKDAVLVSEINEALMPLIQEYRTRYAGEELKKKIEELRKTVIEQAIESKLILQLARRQGITADDKTVDSRLEIVKRRFPSEDAFFEALASRGVTYREYRDQVAEQVLVQETVKRVLGGSIKVSDNEIEEYYRTHPDEFTTEPKVKLAQIFLKHPAQDTPAEMDRVQQKAAQLRILIEDGIDFAQLAEKYSEGPYREKGGLIGVVGPKEILPELEEIAFGLQTGEVSPLIQTDYGFHILKALEAIPSREIGFEEAKPLIEERINEMKRNEQYKDWIRKLREDSFIEVKL